MKRLAVLMSIYKSDNLYFVEKAVNSVLSQTYMCFDFYIYFDGVIQKEVFEYVKKMLDDRVIVIESDENRGLAYALNQLLRISTKKEYEYFARMDADDISVDDRFNKQITFLDNHQNVDCLGSWAVEITNAGKEFYRKKMPITHVGCHDMFKMRDCLIHPSVMFRKSFFIKAGFYPENTYFGEDTMMWAQGFQCKCVFANIPEYLLLFRIDDDFFNRRRGLRHAKSIFKLRLKVAKMLGYGFVGYLNAFIYAMVKLVPVFILRILYKKSR